MCPVRTSAPVSRGEGLAKFAVEGVRVTERESECGEGGVCVCVCVCTYPPCVCPCEFASVCFFLCLTKFRGPDLEKEKGK